MPDESLDDLLRFLRFPSVSADPAHRADMERCAAWLAEWAGAAGLEAAVRPTGGHPAVVARGPARRGRPTVLIYGHYDVQPADPVALWHSPPFEPALRDGIITARGASDNKGQIMAHLAGVRRQLRAGKELPVNVIFLIEGEEEIGSPSLAAFLAANRKEFACDIVAVSDTGMVAPGVPTLTYGLRGIVALEFVVRGPTADLHSGIFGGAVANPVTAAARLVASLHRDDGRVAVEGFYGGVREVSREEREEWAKIEAFSDAGLLRMTGAPALFGEAGYAAVERVWARPTCEVNGFGGGYQGEGSKTVLPASARVKITCRLVPEQRPEDVGALVERHLRAHCPPGVSLEIEVGHHGAPYLLDRSSPAVSAACRALERAFGRPPVLTREGGTIPVVQTFRDVLGADTLLLGLALPDCGAHAPNETFPVAHFEAGQRLNAELLAELARG